MKSISRKFSTQRRAVASARVRASREAIARLRANDLPKPDALPVARVAAVAACKRTSEIIPYCHPIPVDHVAVDFEVGEDTIRITATVEAVARTGVEMEALVAASVAALTIYDMLKAVDAAVEIESTRLESKTGGKSDYTPEVPAGFTAAVLVVSDSAAAGKRQDTSGALVRERLEAAGVAATLEVVPDDQERIAAALLAHCERGTDLVLTTGGTGLGPRDVTVEVTRRVVEREIPGVAEAGRAHGFARTPYAMLARGVAGVRARTVIVNLPGSPRGAEETMDAIFPAILHVFPMLRGGGH